MPGLLHYTVHQGYDYLSPYVEKAQPYVDVARNNVPLVDPALKTAEELLPTLITRADQIAEPRIEKMRPFVQPKIEQVKEKVAPYVDEGVKQYGVLCEESVKFYRVGLEKVEQVKGFKDAKVEQLKGFTDAKEIQIRQFAEPRVEKIKEFTDPKVEKIKEFTQAQTTQIREFADPKVGKIKELMEPNVKIITTKQKKIQKLFRVPASLDLQGLKYETLLGKLASWMEKMEAFLDRYMPLTEEQIKDHESEVSNVSDTSCARINRSVISIMTRPLSAFTVKVMQLSGFPMQLKASYMDGTLKSQIKNKMVATRAKIGDKAEPVIIQVYQKLTPQVLALKQTSLFKKVVQVAIGSSEKTFGKEKTSIILSKVYAHIPSDWKYGTPRSIDESQSPPVQEQEQESKSTRKKK